MLYGLASNHNYEDPEESSSMNSEDLENAGNYISGEYNDLIASPLKQDSCKDDSYYLRSDANITQILESQNRSLQSAAVTKNVSLR